MMEARKRLSGWQLRERLKNNKSTGSSVAATTNTRDESTSEGTSSTSSLHSNDDDKREVPPPPPPSSLPPAHRSVGTFARSKGENRVTKSNQPLPNRALHNQSKKKANASQDVQRKIISKPLQKDQKAWRVQPRKSKKERKEESLQRKSSILDSVGKYQLPSPVPSRKGHHNVDLSRNPYASEQEIEDDNKSEGSMTLDSIPPPEREDSIPGNSTSFNASFDLSGHRTLNSSGHRTMNSSMDLSGHQTLPRYEQIATSASDEQWARFKLLGRLGLGNIQLSDEAKVLVERNYNIMIHAIKHIYALRGPCSEDTSEQSLLCGKSLDIKTGHLLKEVEAMIDIPQEGYILKRDPDTIQIEAEVQRQLMDYIVVISSMYRNNPFHDYEHASNVLGAVDKLIGLVSIPKGGLDYRNLKSGHGIARGPWNHFALVFAAMIHDVDHSGVPNAQLIKEKSHVAGAYKNKSVAEQNSIEISWSLLMEPCYKELRESIFQYRHELVSFRKLLVTAVLATDIADKELAALRKGRASVALEAEESERTESLTDKDLFARKATFVVETLIQVADVSHTMSSFAEFKKWNHRLYKESYRAFKNGRAVGDPSSNWYKGEFGFFDFYIIPLAKKLKDCGVYGADGESYVKNAIDNRRLWEIKGESLVKKYMEEEDREEKDFERKNWKSMEGPSRAQTDILDRLRQDARQSINDTDSASEFASCDSDDWSVSVSSSDNDEGDAAMVFSRVSNRNNRKQTPTLVGRVPSKASIEMRHDRRAARKVSGSARMIRVRSKSPGAVKRDTFNRGSRARSTSPKTGKQNYSGASMDSPQSKSERLELRSILKQNHWSTSSLSPGSTSERSEKRRVISKSARERPRSVDLACEKEAKGDKIRRKIGVSSHQRGKSTASMKSLLHRCRSQSPATERKARSVSNAVNDKNDARGRNASRSKSPATSLPTSQRYSTKSSGNRTRKGGRTSRSLSPGKIGTEERSNYRKADKGLKRGKRPQKS